MAHKGYVMQLPEDMAGLPVLVNTPSDVGRLTHELEMLDNQILQDSLGVKHEGPAKLTKLLEETMRLNKLDSSKQEDRQRLQKFLKEVRDDAPIIHISFSAEPTVAFMEKLVAWLRREVHPLILVTIGLQPNLGAGCVVRTTNKYFDLSLRKDFEKATGKLAEQLAALGSKAQPSSPAMAVDAAAKERQAAAHASEVHA